ncbi:MAG: hypothetical protein PHC66_03330 [Candidatus Nanoarchaeia archaeon]|nr:hypothetical protein [Candidatus Nanoarchaeia archaeon]MDD5239847.1 hypothetical protein [Candidatus Nanoarchaeia archaeon]
MVFGHVLIKTQPGAEKDVYSMLLGLRRVTEVLPLFGEYDLIAKVVINENDSYMLTRVGKKNSYKPMTLGQYIVDNICGLEGVAETTTIDGILYDDRDSCWNSDIFQKHIIKTKS